MQIAIAGGTGFVGKALTTELIRRNHNVFILTRKPISNSNNDQIRYVQWMVPGTDPINDIKDIDVFINLSGESINSGRWTKKRKAKILNSRIEAVQESLEIFRKMERKPKVYINASAIGIYGTSEDKVFTEADCASKTDFLSTTVLEWESAAEKASDLGIRTVFCRFGIILDRQEGALAKIALPYKGFIGGNLGNGQQWMSWIHLEDVVKAILFVMDYDEINGPVNFTAPEPVRMSEFGKTLASVLHRPHWIPVPRFALRLLLGEMSTLVVEGQKVLPNKLLESGYSYSFPNLQSALKNLYR